MFGFVMKVFVSVMMFFSYNLSNVNSLNAVPLKCISLSNQKCEIIPQIININSNNYPYSVQINKCSGSCNNINGSYAKSCFVKNINVKVFNPMSRTKEIRYIEWYETCRYKCRLDASVCNNKQRWNEDKYRCECNELIDKGMCDKVFIWNPRSWEYECDKSCDVGEYLNYENCKCRKRLIDKLVEECSENIDGNKMIHNDCKNVCSSCTVYIVLFVIAFLIIIGISCAFIYFHWYLKRLMLVLLILILALK